MQLKRKLTLILSSLVTFSVGVSIPTSLLVSQKNNLVLSNNNLKGWNIDGGATAETAATFEFKTKDELKNQFEESPFEPKTPKEFTNEDIKQFLKIKTGSASSWHVIKSDVTTDDMVNGVIRFKLYQNLKQADGSYTQQLIKKDEQEEWTTSTDDGISEYIIKNQYSLSWASPEELTDFFENTTLTASQLTKEIVLNNLVSRNSVLPESSQISVTISDVSTDATQYGAKKVKVSFSNKFSKSSGDTSDSATSTIEEEKIFRGFKTTNNLSNEMNLSFTTENIGDWTISDTTVFEGALEPGETKISSLTASEFVNPIDKTDPSKQTALLDMLTKGSYLSSNKKIAEIKYMGLSTTDSEFNNKTGLTADNYKVEKVRTIPNDENGSLEILYTFKCINIFTGEDYDREVKQTFPAGTFKTNPDANKILKFSWYAEEALMPLGGSFDMVNSFKKNQDDPNFGRLLSNQFFSGTQDTYDKPRTVSLDFKDGSTFNSQTNSYEPTVTNQQEVLLTLTFDSWNGAFYTENNVVKSGFKTSKVFALDSYNVENNTVNFKTQNDFIATNPTFEYNTPSSIILNIKEGIYNNSVFFSMPTTNTLNYEVSYVPNNRDGTVSVTISFYENNGDTKTYKGSYFRIYSGMKKVAEDSDILEFTWIPSTSVSSELLSIPIDEVTKTDVIDYYLINIPMFANKTLNENNVDIKVEGDSTLKVDVTIYNFDQANPNIKPEEQKFFTKITGFANTTFSSDADVIPPKDITALISIPVAAIVTCILVFILVTMVSRRAKIRHFKEPKEKKQIKKSKIDSI